MAKKFMLAHRNLVAALPRCALCVSACPVECEAYSSGVVKIKKE
jgi:hypothetical protein